MSLYLNNFDKDKEYNFSGQGSHIKPFTSVIYELS
jgi:hypothetical protein